MAISGTIVVGVDGSASADRALDWAVEEAANTGRALTLVHAVGALAPAWFDQAVVDLGTAREVAEGQGRELLEAARRHANEREPDIELNHFLSLDDPREVLLELAKEAAMVVVGSRGRGRMQRLLLGSVGVALVRHAECPVVVHRTVNPGLVRQGVLVGADGTPGSAQVIEFAYRQAALRDLPLTVVHAFWDLEAASLETVAVAEAPDAAEERLLMSESIAGLAEQYPEVHTTVEVIRGRPHPALVSLADRMDLVVLGHRHGDRMAQLLFGSVAVGVVESATCPVAVVPVVVP